MTLESGQTGLVHFASTLSGTNGISGADGTSVQFDGDLTLSGGDTANTLLGDVTFDGMSLASDADLTLGNATTGDQVSLSGGDVSYNFV